MIDLGDLNFDFGIRHLPPDGEEPYNIFNLQSKQQIVAVIDRHETPDPNAVSQIVIVASQPATAFNVISYAFTKGRPIESCTFTRVTDPDQLGECLRGLGAKDVDIAVWNHGHPGYVIPLVAGSEYEMTDTLTKARANPGAVSQTIGSP